MSIDHTKRGKSNGYVILSGNTTEHRVIGAEVIGRSLGPDEEVHHLDFNRTNNSPDNTLVLAKSQHTKLHEWLNNNIVIPKPKYAARKARGCIRCLHCEKPISPSNEKYCSRKCANEHRHVIKSYIAETETPKHVLEALVTELPFTSLTYSIIRHI